MRVGFSAQQSKGIAAIAMIRVSKGLSLALPLEQRSGGSWVAGISSGRPPNTRLYAGAAWLVTGRG